MSSILPAIGQEASILPMPAGYTRDVHQVWASGRGNNSASWATPQPLLARDLSNAEFPSGAWSWDGDVLVGHGVTLWAEGKGNLWTRESYGDFALSLEFRCEEQVESGVFLRVGDVGNWLQTSSEVQLLQGANEKSSHLTGAIFDCAGPTRKATIKPGQWHSLVIISRADRISVFFDSEPINDVYLNEWVNPGKNPDGTDNGFKNAVKERPRMGRIGLQYHGEKIEFRNLLIETLPAPSDSMEQPDR